MPSRQHRRKSPDDLGAKLKRRFYKGAAIATAAYVTLSLIRFHGEYSYLPYALAVIWAVFLLCYTTFKEVIRWSDVGDEEEVYHGEFWAGLVVAGMGWMIGWNIVREWAFHAPSLPLPEDYQAATIETIVLYTLSVISSLLYKHKAIEQSDRENSHGGAVNNGSNLRATVKNRQMVIEPVSKIPPARVASDFPVSARRGEEAVTGYRDRAATQAVRENHRNPLGYGPNPQSHRRLLLGVRPVLQRRRSSGLRKFPNIAGRGIFEIGSGPIKNQDVEVVLIKNSKLSSKNSARKND